MFRALEGRGDPQYSQIQLHAIAQAKRIELLLGALTKPAELCDPQAGIAQKCGMAR
jgi:hypothetical protein